MTSRSKRAPRRPPGVWRDAQVYGAKLKAIRTGRKLSAAAAAVQIGLATREYTKLEQGSFLPARWIQERIYRWAVNGETFENVPSPKRRDLVEVSKWREVKVRLQPELHEKLLSAAGRLRLSHDELVALAVDKLLNAPGELARYEQASERLERVKVAAALQECPNLRHFLEAELQMAIDMGAKVVRATEPTPPIDLMQLP